LEVIAKVGRYLVLHLFGVVLAALLRRFRRVEKSAHAAGMNISAATRAGVEAGERQAQSI
jgi:hypothetical protein